MSATPRHPVNIIATSSSSRSSLKTWLTPALPATVSPAMASRPTSTAEAPSASALRTSVPRRTPPSISTGTAPSLAFTMAGSKVIVAGPAGAGLDGLAGVVRVHNALEDHRQGRILAKPLHIGPPG